jgi:FKBP-type peptidyl-prolyl cis-trans isomerase
VIAARCAVVFCALAIAACRRHPQPETPAQPPAASVPRTIDKGEGCLVEITKDGDGPVARIGDEVTLAYEMRVKDAEQPIASTRGWDVPCRMRLGGPGVLPGLSRGVEGLKVGTLAKLELPPALAYGKDGCPGSSVPADATLVFEVEVLGVRP